MKASRAKAKTTMDGERDDATLGEFELVVYPPPASWSDMADNTTPDPDWSDEKICARTSSNADGAWVGVLFGAGTTTVVVTEPSPLTATGVESGADGSPTYTSRLFKAVENWAHIALFMFWSQYRRTTSIINWRKSARVKLANAA